MNEEFNPQNFNSNNNFSNPNNQEFNPVLANVRPGIMTVIVGCWIRIVLCILAIAEVFAFSNSSTNSVNNVNLPAWVNSDLFKYIRIAFTVVSLIYAIILLVLAYKARFNEKLVLPVAVMAVIAIFYGGLITLIGGIIMLTKRNAPVHRDFAQYDPNDLQYHSENQNSVNNNDVANQSQPDSNNDVANQSQPDSNNDVANQSQPQPQQTQYSNNSDDPTQPPSINFE